MFFFLTGKNNTKLIIVDTETANSDIYCPQCGKVSNNLKTIFFNFK